MRIQAVYRGHRQRSAYRAALHAAGLGPAPNGGGFGLGSELETYYSQARREAAAGTGAGLRDSAAGSSSLRGSASGGVGLRSSVDSFAQSLGPDLTRQLTDKRVRELQRQVRAGSRLAHFRLCR